MNVEQTKRLCEIERKIYEAYKSLQELNKEVSKSLKQFDNSSEVEELQTAVNLTCDAIDSIQFCKDEFGCQQ